MIRMDSELIELAEAVTAARSKLDELTGQAESDDGLIRAQVDLNGALVSLDLDARIYRTTDSRALADEILATAKAAHDEVTRRALVVARTSLGLPEGSEDLLLGPVLHQLSLREERRSPSWLT
jgi:DNA-binding protein YbaB